MEQEPIKVLVISENESYREEVEIFSDHIRMVDYDIYEGEVFEGFSVRIPIETLRKIMAAI